MTGIQIDDAGIPPIEERYDLRHLTTFVPNKRTPIHNWFYYKEGFAREFVVASLEWMGVGNGTILDPFVGSGTTVLTAREVGMSSVGVDVSPLMILVSRAKCQDYSVDLLSESATEVFSVKFAKPDLSVVPREVRRYFSKYVLEDIVFFRSLIAQVQDQKVRDFLHVLLISSAIKASYAYKDGAVLRVRKRHAPPFRKFFRAKTKRAIKELQRFKPLGPEPTLYVGDARRLDFLDDSSVDCIVTSPPYLNKIEYTRVYGIEYSLFLPDVAQAPMRSYIGLDVKPDKQLFPSLPPVANAYFTDLRRALAEMWRVMKDGSKATILIAGGVFPTGVVDSDMYLCTLAVELGFKVDRILALNSRVATRDRVVKIGEARESAVILSK
jgi:SAM-dependent methyltransferase